MKKFFGLLLLLTLAGCATTNHKAHKGQEPGVVSVMAYNVENLFDTVHDPNRNDWAYLPLDFKKKSSEHRQACEEQGTRYLQSCLNMDWSNEILERKMQRLADVILQVNDGRGPDILMMEEVENERVLKRLRDGYLKKANYQTLVLIEGPDKRGIDVALMSRLPQAEPAQLHVIPFKGKSEKDQEWMEKSRGILQTNLRLPDGETLTIFGVHFPSPSNPQYWREQAIDHLIKLKNKLPAGRMYMAGGDFNIAAEEEAKAGQYRTRLAKDFQISHLIGCKGCRGTNYYHTKRSWSFLDALVFSKEMSQSGSAGWYIEPDSIYIPTESKYQVNRWLSPARFESHGPVGVSDHWPIMGWLRPKKKPPAQAAH
ncbi:MAG: endonuclease/exonuclease/phosphatase family protein [Bdellovibrionaceae bacterium]|nr:endonuclease/exonuclease/phosphatase family protein [Bdellovibrionales bacterium]MCB9084189.1 endonuclease/exonuclease/phosphatase family protein [Pseudobdellovibrionaceae bacterium]